MQDEPQRSSASGLTLDVEAEPLELRRGETLHIQLTVANTGETTVVRHFQSGCIYGFALLDAGGERVAPPPRICTANAPTVEYMAGEVVTLEFSWVWDDAELESGTYRLIVGLGRHGEVESAPEVEVQLR
jgi:hypothetical protein